MRILFVAAEAAPIAKVGGMGDVVGALPKILRQLGHDVRIFMPYYGFLPDKMDIPNEPVWRGAAMFQNFEVYQGVLPVLMFLSICLVIRHFLPAAFILEKMNTGALLYSPTVRQNLPGTTGNQKLSTVTTGTLA